MMLQSELANALIGKTMMQAKKLCAENGMTIRQMMEDGKHLIGTCDMRSNRFNVATEKGKITRILRMG